MTPELSREQRQAIDEQQGAPVYIVDLERRETFVLLSSTEFDRCLPTAAIPVRGPRRETAAAWS
jgi:hypothetical protein